MRLLLDTHVFIWSVKDDRRLSKAVRSKIAQASEVYISSASIWELAIKVRIGKIHINIDQLKESIVESEFLELPITAQHATKVAHLPLLHRDPFDRILIAQAISEPLTLLTADTQFKDYSELIEIID